MAIKIWDVPNHVQWIEYDLISYLQTKVEVAPNFKRMGLELAQKDRPFKTTPTCGCFNRSNASYRNGVKSSLITLLSGKGPLLCQIWSFLIHHVLRQLLANTNIALLVRDSCANNWHHHHHRRRHHNLEYMEYHGIQEPLRAET